LNLLGGFGGGDRSVDMVGFATAVALVLLARWLLPAYARPRVKQPLVYVVLAVPFGITTAFLGSRAGMGRVCAFFYTFFLLASCGRSLVLLGVDVVFGRRIHRPPPRIFRDVTQAIVYVVVVLVTLHKIDVEPSSLLTTSALLTAVVGLALQDTLGNMVSGLALQMQTPFEVGDWIQFDPDKAQIGQVTEVNWRATTVRTSDLVEVIVPNALLARTPIRNYSRPSPVMRRSVTVSGPYEASPRRVHDAIMAALASTAGVLADPPPWVQTRSFADSGIEYAVYFFCSDFAARDRIDGEVRDRVWYALQRADVPIPFPQRTVHMHAISDETRQRGREVELERRDRALRCVDFLDVLPPEAHRSLAAAALVRMYSPGEAIISHGESTSELYVIERGEVIVELPRDHGHVEVARLGRGKFFGEMGMMTGAARRATVRAATECELLVINHEAFHDTLAENRDVVERISDLLAARQTELEAVASSRRPAALPEEDRSRRLISQIKSFFNL